MNDYRLALACIQIPCKMSFITPNKIIQINLVILVVSQKILFFNQKIEQI